MLKGRKVTEPVVQQGTAPTEDYYHKTGPPKLWGSTDKAKSETVVDNYGRSAYLKSKTEHIQKPAAKSDAKDIVTGDIKTDKIARKKAPSARSNPDLHDGAPAQQRKKKGLGSAPQLQQKTYNHGSHKTEQSRKVQNINPRRVEFSNLIDVCDNDVNIGGGANTINGTSNGYSGVYSGRDLDPFYPDSAANEQSTLTNSRDIRETEINFLNNNLTVDLDYNCDKNNFPGSRLTHVSVTVPGATRTTSTGSKYSSATRHTHKNSAAGAAKRDRVLDILVLPESPGDMDGRMSDMSQSDSESGQHRRFKGIRSLDPDGLAKIKETIRKQQSKSKENNEDMLSDVGPASEPPLNARLLHDASEPLVAREPDGAEKTPKVRKIAAGPAAPSYKGFSETEVKYRIVEKQGKSERDSSRDKKRHVSLKLQEKNNEPLATWLNIQEGEDKNKKVTRVIAPSRKSSKQQSQAKHKEIITTSSWRAGQELILRELGPVKRRPDRIKDANRNDNTSPTCGEGPDSDHGDGDEFIGVTATELQNHRALSEEARKVYNDLHLDDNGIDAHKRSGSKEHRYKPPTKRKAPKVTETEKQQQSSAKQRHYDAEQIRKYMQRQKAERLKRQKDEETRHKEEEEARRRQLDELRTKQKQASAQSAALGRKDKGRHRPAYESLPNDLSRHPAYHMDKTRLMMSGENKENMEDADMDVSDSSSTITGDDSDNDTPTQTPRRGKMGIDGSANARITSLDSHKHPISTNKPSSSSQPQSLDNNNPPSSSNAANIKTFGDFSFDITGVTSKFTLALQEKLNEEPGGALSGAGAGASGRVNGQAEYVPDSNHVNDGYAGRSRSDRIQAIKDTAATLQNRLKEEARKIQAQSTTSTSAEHGATSRPSVRWNDTMETTRRDREQEFMSRYEQVTAANDDFSVFNSNLPGNTHSSQPPTIPPVAKQSSKLSSANKSDNAEDPTVTETSTFSEITLTDESDNETESRKIASSNLHGVKPDFIVKDGAKQLNIPPPSRSTAGSAVRPTNSWEDSTIDEYNVFNIYSRRLDRIIRPGREPMSKKKSQTSSVEPEIQSTNIPSQSTAPAVKPTHPEGSRMTVPARARSPGLAGRQGEPQTVRSRSPGVGARLGGDKSESLRTQSSAGRAKLKGSSRLTADSTDENDDTLGEDSYTQTFDTEDKTSSRMKTVTDKYPGSLPSHRSLQGSVKSATKAAPATVAVDDESSLNEELSQDEDTPRAEPVSMDTQPSRPARLSANELEQKFYSAFNNLETMEMSIKQLTSVDRTRAVSMAQQETVSLAQMLKAKQQGYELQMKDIQLKAQIEATEATKQLEDARKRASDAAINAADMIAKVRGEGTAIQESTRKLIVTQTEAAKATAEAAKFLSEARGLAKPDKGKGEEGGARKGKAGKTTSTKRRSKEDGEDDDTESVASVEDYSIDVSLTEDEREEKSYRLILPSESHRKKGKHQHSDNESVTSEASSTRMLDQDFQSLFAGEEGFDKFTEDMVKQFMKEEEVRAQHQASLLRLRESALLEKTKAELQWLEQQKQRLRNKGADDSYPQIKKRQRGLKIKLQEQQEEIRRLKEENKAAAKERQRQLYQEINKRHASQTQAKPGQSTASKGRLGRPNEVHTEAEVSSIDEASDVERKQRKNYKSDSEIYTEPKSNARHRKHESKTMEKYKKNLEEKYLTNRQHRLMDRKKNAQELLKWKKTLDAEENRVLKLEKKALKVWDDPKKDKEPSQSLQSLATKDETDKPTTISKKNGTAKDSTIKTASAASLKERDSTVMSENISTARDESLYSSIREDIKTASDVTSQENHKRRMNDKNNIKNASGSEESSVMEDILSPSSMDDSKKLNESSDDTVTHSYNQETFEESATATATSSMQHKKNIKTQKSPLDDLKRTMMSLSSPRSPRSLFSAKSHTRTSESESEDSYSIESQSELSDFEGRIRDLNEKLRHRKVEADRLKRERKKKKRELMKNKEESLKKQIEAYDNQIKTLKTELQKEIAQEPKSSVRPQIKQPKVSPPKNHQNNNKTPNETSITISGLKPSSNEEPEIKSPKSTSISASKAALDRISEGSESASKSERSERSDTTTYKEKVRSIKDLTSESFSMSKDEGDKTEEIDEDIEEVVSEASDDKSQEIKIDLRQVERQDLYDVSVSNAPEMPDDASNLSYTEDFASEIQTTTKHDKLPFSERTAGTHSHVSEDIDAKTGGFHSARSLATDPISEQITENIQSIAGDDSFMQSFQLKIPKQAEDLDNERSQQDNESENENENSRYSNIESSRPSSGKSERSTLSLTEHESSESERSPHLSATKADKFFDQENAGDTIKATKPAQLFTGDVLDIDDLIGPPDDITPLMSGQSTPTETPKQDSETSRMSNFYEPLADFENGDRVSVTGPSGERVLGTLLFRGNVQFAPGIWAGVELEKPEGRHNGMEDGVRYFTCRDKHGLIVPGHDLQVAPEDGVDFEEGGDLDTVNIRDQSMSSINTDDGDLQDLIDQAARNVEEFIDSPEATPRDEPDHDIDQAFVKSNKDILADKITNDLFESVVKGDLEAIRNIANKQRKVPPPVAPKPQKSRSDSHSEESTRDNDNEIESDIEEALPSEQDDDQISEHLFAPENDRAVNDTTDSTVTNLMNDAIEHMLNVRKHSQQQHISNQQAVEDQVAAQQAVVGQVQQRPTTRDIEDSGNFEEEEEEPVESTATPTEEIEDVIGQKEEDNDMLHIDTPLRPGSPVPGLQSHTDDHVPREDSGTFEYDEELWTTPTRAPPPYPSSDNDTPRSDYKKMSDEVFYAVPHDEREIDGIVSSAVDEFWEQRRYGEPLTDLQPTEAFYTHEEIGSDLISNSRRVFKKLLFDLSGEVIRNIYREEEYDSPVAWHKPKRKTNKFYKGASPPTTVDVLKPVVQQAILDILGLSGARKSADKSKWGIRKKKDLVDSILVQELREEEPEWVNYDDDELAVKMQLTETIFDNLLTDTVQTMNKIFRRKQSMQAGK